jgi:hypothetical protein
LRLGGGEMHSQCILVQGTVAKLRKRRWISSPNAEKVNLDLWSGFGIVNCEDGIESMKMFGAKVTTYDFPALAPIGRSGGGIQKGSYCGTPYV